MFVELFNNLYKRLRLGGHEEAEVLRKIAAYPVCPTCGEVLIPLGLYQNDTLQYCPVCKKEVLQSEFPGQSSRSDRGEYTRGVPPVPIRS